MKNSVCYKGLKCRKHDCCDHPSPIRLSDALKMRGIIPSKSDVYATECYACNHICRCESNSSFHKENN